MKTQNNLGIVADTFLLKLLRFNENKMRCFEETMIQNEVTTK